MTPTDGAIDARAVIAALTLGDNDAAHRIITSCAHPWDALHHAAGLAAALIRAVATELLDTTPADFLSDYLGGVAAGTESSSS